MPGPLSALFGIDTMIEPVCSAVVQLSATVKNCACNISEGWTIFDLQYQYPLLAVRVTSELQTRFLFADANIHAYLCSAC